MRGKDGFQVGKEALDLRYVEQIVDVEQTAALAAMLRYTMEHINGSKRISEIVEMLEKEISNGGLEAVVGGGLRKVWLGDAAEAGDLRML